MEIIALVCVVVGSLFVAERWGDEGRVVERSRAYREALAGAIREPYEPVRSVLHDVAPDRTPLATLPRPAQVPATRLEVIHGTSLGGAVEDGGGTINPVNHHAA